MKLRHIRNGKELNRIIEDDNYDFNYQQVRQLENETTILPGDYIITDCAYEVNHHLYFRYYYYYTITFRQSEDVVQHLAVIQPNKKCAYHF